MNPKKPNIDEWYEENIDPHIDMLRAWLLNRFPDIEDVDDLVQESIRKLLKMENLMSLKSPKGYLFTTARNLAIDSKRREKVVKFEPLADDSDSFVNTNETSAADELDNQQELEMLNRAIDSLPPRCRQIFRMRKVQGLSHDEISKRLDISRHTIDTQIAIGLSKCRKFFENIYKP